MLGLLMRWDSCHLRVFFDWVQVEREAATSAAVWTNSFDPCLLYAALNTSGLGIWLVTCIQLVAEYS
jgi:hypothetical protein